MVPFQECVVAVQNCQGENPGQNENGSDHILPRNVKHQNESNGYQEEHEDNEPVLEEL